jgi:hypothetical protein
LASTDFNNGSPAGDSPYGPGGWNINFNSSDLIADNCEIWIGVEECDFSKGKKVGNSVISSGNFHYCLDEEQGYVSREFHLYAGQCFANDKAIAATDSIAECETAAIAQYAREIGEFPLIYQTPQYTDVFNFDHTFETGGAYANENYVTFPLRREERKFLTGYLEVCYFDPANGPAPVL